MGPFLPVFLESEKEADWTVTRKKVAAAGVIKAGHTGWNQAEVAARNVLHLIAGTGEPLERYERSPPQIKVTLGLVRRFFFSPLGQGRASKKLTEVCMHSETVSASSCRTCRQRRPRW